MESFIRLSKTQFLSSRFSTDHFAFLLQRCLKSKALWPGKQVHAMILVTGTDLNAVYLNSNLVGVYASCGYMKSARTVFDKIQKPNTFALNWMILASAFNGNFLEAIGYFSLMRESLNFCNKFTFSIVLKACVGLMDLNKGKQVHAVVNNLGFENDLSVANVLIDMYGKCNCLDDARRVFDKMPNRDVVSWTSMICGYSAIGNIDQALVLFQNMNMEGFEPNDFTWNTVISSCARQGDNKGVFELFSRMMREGLVPDLATWNGIISGFAQSQQAGAALKWFGKMLVSRVKPNHMTVTGVLPACGLMCSIQMGRELHGLIFRRGLEINVFIGSALIDMYSKCGSVKDAFDVFNNLRLKNVTSWNAMIGCYGKHGMVDSALKLFERMQEEGIQANQVTLTCVLSACSYVGLVEEGSNIFRSMKERYGVNTGKEHYACVVDLLSRSGKMVEAFELIKEMSMEVTESIVGAFFNGCKIHGRRDLAKLMAHEILRMDLKEPGGFVTLSNIYAADEKWDAVESVRKMMKEKKVIKKPGFSRLERRDDFIDQT